MSCRPGGPFTWQVDFDAAPAVVASTALPGLEPAGGRGVCFTLPTMPSAIRCGKALSGLVAAPAEPGYD